MCNPWQAGEFRAELEMFDPEEFCECLPLCAETKYKSELSSAPFRSYQSFVGRGKFKKLNYRRCDSRNLNLSPVCNFSSTTGPFFWKAKVSEVYRMFGDVPNYIKNKEDANRHYYPDEYLIEREIITSLIEVCGEKYFLNKRIIF